MAKSKSAIPLKTSINTDHGPEHVFAFGDDGEHVQNTGIFRDGGITNISRKDTAVDPTGLYSIADSGAIIELKPNGSVNDVLVDGTKIGSVSPYGVQSRTKLTGWDDAALSADGTIIAIRYNSAATSITIAEISLTGTILHTRDVVIAAGNTFWSLSLVRYMAMHYADSQEFIGRITSVSGGKFIKESFPFTKAIR